MSADNFLAIVLQNDGKYYAYDRCPDSEGSCILGPRVYADECGHGIEQPKFIAKSLVEAVHEAERYVLNNIVEYGYQFLNLPEEDAKEKTQPNLVEEENME